MHVTFENPFLLLLLLLLPCFYYCRRKVTGRFLPKLVWIPRRSRLLHSALLYRIVIFALGVVALAAPVAYSAKFPSHREGVAIVLALDTSGSMRESGFAKGSESKFTLLQRVAGDFIRKRSGDNIGIVAFGTFAFAASPISYDTEGVRTLLDLLEVEIAGKNTAIGDAIAQSVRMLKRSKAKEKIIVLVTDGKNNSGTVSVKAAVETAKKEGIKIYSIGLGDAKSYDAALLKRIASESGGKMFGASDIADLKKVYATIDGLLPSPLRSHHYRNPRPLFLYPLFLAIVLLSWYHYKRVRAA